MEYHRKMHILTEPLIAMLQHVSNDNRCVYNNRHSTVTTYQIEKMRTTPCIQQVKPCRARPMYKRGEWYYTESILEHFQSLNNLLLFLIADCFLFCLLPTRVQNCILHISNLFIPVTKAKGDLNILCSLRCRSRLRK